MQLYDDYDVKDMTFNPAVAAPRHKKKKVRTHATYTRGHAKVNLYYFFFPFQEVFRVKWSLLDGDLQRLVDDSLRSSQEAELDFWTTHKH